MPNRRPVIVIDPGHGGSAAVGGSSANNATGPNGLLEKNLTLDLARRLSALLAAEAEVVLTRARDVNLALAARARVARDRQAALFLSLHLNGFHDAQTDGTETWIARTANAQSRAFAQTLQHHVVAVTGVNDRGLKESNLGVLLPERHAPHTAACLLEVAFLTNPAQARRLTDESYKQRIAEAIATALRQHLPTATLAEQSLATALPQTASKRIPLAFFKHKFDAFINRRRQPLFKLRIDQNKVSVTFDPEFAKLHNLKPKTIDLGHLEVPLPVLPDPNITLSDINSSGMQLAVRAVSQGPGSNVTVPEFSFRISFETKGEEIKINNFPNVDLTQLELELRLKLIVDKSRLSVIPDVETSIRWTINNAPDGIVNVEKKIKEKLREKLIKAFDAPLRAKIGEQLSRWLLGGLLEVRAVRASAQEIIIDYVEPAPGSLVQPFPERPQPATTPGNLSKIDHIVVLMLENRSFDHMLGYLSLQGGRTDLDGLKGGEKNLYKGREFRSFPLAETLFTESPCHDHPCVLNQMANGMGGFVADFASRYEKRGVDPGKVMGYYRGEQLPVYDLLAREFGVCDRWFCTHPGPTWPNRYQSLTGRLNRDGFGRFEYDNPDTAIYTPSHTKTIFDHLEERQVNWRYYEHGYCFLRLYRQWTTDISRIRPARDAQDGFFVAAREGRLPAVSFIDPKYIDDPPGNDDHPPADVRDGQRLVAEIVTALMNGPRWDKTLLIITYDEHGGFFDHVEPPPAPNVSGIDRYGPRVPALIISPWIKRGAVSHTVFDHCSILKTIVRRFCAANPPDLGERANQAKDVGELLTLAQPRTDRPKISLPAGTQQLAAEAAAFVPKLLGRDFHSLLAVMRRRFPIPAQPQTSRAATAHALEGAEQTEQTWGAALAYTPTLSNNARLEWQDLTMGRGSDRKDHLYYLTSGGPEGTPATFNLKVTNTNSVYNFNKATLKVRLSKKLADGSFRTIPLRGQTGEFKIIPSQEIADESSRIIPIAIERATLWQAYNASPDTPFTRLEVEFHWTEGGTYDRYASYHYNRHSLAFFLVRPFEFLFKNKQLARRVALNDEQKHRQYWTGIWEKEFSAADQTPLTIATTIQTALSQSGTDEITLTHSTTQTTAVQRGVEQSQTSTSKASFGLDEVVKVGLEQQESASVKTSLNWSESVARQFSESLRSSHTFTQSFTKSLQITSQISPAAAGKIKTLYVYPIFELYKVKLVRFEGPNRLGQATRRTEVADAPVMLFSHWGNKQVESDARPARGQALAAVAFSAEEGNPVVRQTLERFLERFANIPVIVAGSSVVVRPPYFINRDNERKRRALENRRTAPQADKDIFEPAQFRFARVGKSSIEELRTLLQLAVDRQRLTAPNAESLRNWLIRYGLGIDCSGFVVQALNETFLRVHGGPLEANQLLQLNVHNSAALKGGARGFTSVARADQLRPGDTMHKPGHIRLVTRVEITSEGHVKFMTAESSSVNDIGPTHNVWRYRNRAEFSGLQKESNRAWDGTNWQTVSEQDTFGRYNLLARQIEATSPPRTQALAQHNNHAFAAPFAVYGVAQQSTPRIGWPDAPSGGRNAGETSVQGMRRIPLAGLRLGNQQAAAAKGVREAAAGRAIVLLPTELEPSHPVETLLHLHGYNVGYRQRGSTEPRDLAVDRIPEQVAASRRNLIAVLPQGTTTSGFGTFDTNTYLDEIFAALDSLGVWRGNAPQRGRVILSGHSGAGGTIAGILSERDQPRLPRALAALLLFDAINVRSGHPPSDSNELRAAMNYVRARLARDLAALQGESDAAARLNYVQNSPRLRGYFTPGHYANLYRPLDAAISEWFRAHQSELQSRGSNIESALRSNYSLTPVSSLVPSGQIPNHDRILALGNVLQTAFSSAASPATTFAVNFSAPNEAAARFLQSLPRGNYGNSVSP